MLLIVACGQKGPLFLPGDSSQISTTVPVQLPSPPEAVDEEEDEDDEPEINNQ